MKKEGHPTYRPTCFVDVSSGARFLTRSTLRASDKTEEINKAIAELREAAKGEDLERIKEATEKMNTFMHELSAKLYEQAKAQEGEAAAGDTGKDDAASDADNVVDADFDVQDEEEEVKEEDKKEDKKEDKNDS